MATSPSIDSLSSDPPLVALPEHSAAEPATSREIPPAEPGMATVHGEWTSRDQLVISLLAALILLGMLIRLIQLTLQGGVVEIRRPAERRFEFQIDVNQATWVEWMQLEGIGESLARQIVADRDQRGRFQSIEDVDRVRGIGPAKMQAIRPHLRLGTE